LPPHHPAPATPAEHPHLVGRDPPHPIGGRTQPPRRRPQHPDDRTIRPLVQLPPPRTPPLPGIHAPSERRRRRPPDQPAPRAPHPHKREDPVRALRQSHLHGTRRNPGPDHPERHRNPALAREQDPPHRWTNPKEPSPRHRRRPMGCPLDADSPHLLTTSPAPRPHKDT